MDRSTNRHRHIAPRLASGLKRISNASALPPHIKRALDMVAAARGESRSWVLEQIVYSHFALRPPKFVGTRTPDPTVAAPATVKYPRSA